MIGLFFRNQAIKVANFFYVIGKGIITYRHDIVNASLQIMLILTWGLSLPFIGYAITKVFFPSPLSLSVSTIFHNGLFIVIGLGSSCVAFVIGGVLFLIGRAFFLWIFSDVELALNGVKIESKWNSK